MGQHDRQTDEYSWGLPNYAGKVTNPYRSPLSVFDTTACGVGGPMPVVAPQLHPVPVAEPAPAPHPQVVHACSFSLFERCLFALFAVFGIMAEVTFLFVVLFVYRTAQELGRLGELGGVGI